MDELSRRKFLGLLGAMGIITAVPVRVDAQTKVALGTLKEGYSYLTRPEAAFVEAAVARIIPKDELGPGALEAGVPYFIDQQLSGAYGTGAKFYRQGPWKEGAPEQGYQLPLSPQEIYRTGIMLTDKYCASRHGKIFSSLTPKDQDDVLKGLESGEISLPNFPGKTFFGVLHQNTVEGFFADPIYGGNRNKAGWELVGFPGVSAAYVGMIESYRNKPYNVEPVGIADVLQGTVGLDKHGHPIHKPKK